MSKSGAISDPGSRPPDQTGAERTDEATQDTAGRAWALKTDALLTELAALRAELATARDRNQELFDKVDAIGSMLAKAEAERDSTQGSYDILAIANGNLARERDEAEAEVERLTQKLANSEQSYRYWNGLAVQANGLLDEAQHDLAAARDELGRVRVALKDMLDGLDYANEAEGNLDPDEEAWFAAVLTTARAALATPTPERQDEGSERGEAER